MHHVLYDQGQTNVCSAIVAHSLARELGHDVSILWAYYVARLAEGQTRTTLQDTGVRLSRLLKTIEERGVVPEHAWPFRVSHVNEVPPEALTPSPLPIVFRRTQPARGDTRFPVGFVAEMSPRFKAFLQDPAATHSIYSGTPDTDPIDPEGHAMLIIGYDPAVTREGAYLCRSSWGSQFGACGNVYLPARYVENPQRCEQFFVASREGRGFLENLVRLFT